MKTYLFTFADGMTVRAMGCDREAAQENAIEELEAAGVVHTSIVLIQVAA